ncbi:MAG: hypothetical protein C0524_19535 [Rhodobacter sp.]|nr:hypothetical protein [Rhodobacter sp.]
MTGNLAMGSNKITGLAAATNAGDAVRFDQLPSITPTTATLTAGTNAQGQGPITTDQVTITTAAANPSGATLPTAVAGDRVIIANRGANPVNIYPATGASIGALAANAPVLLAVNQSVEFFARSATQWEGQISQPLNATLTSLAGQTLVAGDLIRATGPGAVARIPAGTSGQVLAYDAGGIPVPTTLPSATAPPVSIFRDQKTAGTDGGTFTQDGDRTRALNNTQINQISGASLASNQITLPAGTYLIDAMAPANQVLQHVAWLFNVTDAATVISGTAGFAGNALDSTVNYSFVKGVITIAATKVFELRHRCSSTKTTDGFGRPSAIASEIYSVVQITKLA